MGCFRAIGCDGQSPKLARLSNNIAITLEFLDALHDTSNKSQHNCDVYGIIVLKP